MVNNNATDITISESDTDFSMPISNNGYSMLNCHPSPNLSNAHAVDIGDSDAAHRPAQLDLNGHNGAQFQGQPLNSPTTSDYSSTRTHSSSDVDELSDGMAPALPSKQPIPTCTNSDSSRSSDWSDASGQSRRQKPDGRIRVRTMCLLGALLPGIGCYICIAYTYLFQLDRVLNFTTTECPHVKSYSIGVWKPQKYFWLMILALHLPPRMVYGLAYKNQYQMCESQYKQRQWFSRMVWWHLKLIWLEGAGLVTVSIIDIETYFVPHAICFAVWVIAFCFNMLFNTILHHHSGIRQLTPTHDTIFYIKCGLFLLGYLLSWSTAFSYSIYVVLCSSFAYALFSMAEYVLVGCNSLFYFLLVWELSGGRFEFYVSHKCHQLGSTKADVSMT